MDSLAQTTIAVIGLGYVGLPLAVEFATRYPVVGFDISEQRIDELRSGYDLTNEVPAERLLGVQSSEKEGTGLCVTNDIVDIRNVRVYIVTVPTPVDKNNRPDLTYLFSACETVGLCLKAGDTVIFESTVYPGLTEEECVPLLEKYSGLNINEDFWVGYSPERINPGDKSRPISSILKITSGSNTEAGAYIDALYRSIIPAGTYLAPSIKVAEAAKVIENAQRDINIAFVNELAKIFKCLDIDTHEVLEAASTKWNFLNFKPGLVGGHCIGVDPYYLAQKAQSVGYHPEIILAGRRLNDGMGEYVAHEVIRLMVKKDISIKHAHILVLGIAFKENCPDVRNTKVVNLVRILNSYEINVTVFDPLARPEAVKTEYDLESVNKLPDEQRYDAIVLAVAHDDFKTLNWKKLAKPNSVLYDVKGLWPKAAVNGRL